MIRILIGIFLLISVSNASSILPVKAEIPYVMDYTKETRCIVRKFKVYEDPKWVAKIELVNGKKLFFSSPKSMIEFYHRPGKWYEIGVKSEKDFKNIIVTDYLTMKPIDAKKAFYIYGTNITSPAGDDLVSIGNESDARKFAKQHYGKRVLRFDQISSALIRLINGRI